MSQHSDIIKTIRKALDVYSMIGIALPGIDREAIKAAQKELEDILGIDRQAEFQEAMEAIRAGDRLKNGNLSLKEKEEALNILARYRNRDKQQARPEQKADPDSAIISYYEAQLSEGRA
jgi:hypothetical protein